MYGSMVWWGMVLVMGGNEGQGAETIRKGKQVTNRSKNMNAEWKEDKTKFWKGGREREGGVRYLKHKSNCSAVHFKNVKSN